MKSFSLTLLSGSVFLGICGCGANSSLTHAPVSLPADWKNAGGFPIASPSRDLSRWWSRFNDPVLSRLISESLQSSPDIVTATARIKESRARRDATRASLFPSLNSSASASHRTSKTDNFGTVNGESYSAGLDASWEVDLFGRNRSAVEIASANLGATEENYHSVQASLASEIASTYTSLRTTENRLVILHQTIKIREETTQLAVWRTKAGESDSLESNQAISSLDQARAAVPSQEQSASQSRNLLALLVGKNPGSLDAILSSGSKGIPVPPNSLAIGIPADTIRQRPDVRVAGYQLLGAAASVRAANAQLYPSLNLSGSLGMNSISVSGLVNPQTLSRNISAGISSPIFDAGRIRANIVAASAVEEQSIQTYRSVVLTGLSDTEDALSACRRSAERMVLLEKATITAREADTLSRQRYEAGEIDFNTVLDTQSRLLSLEDSLLSVQSDRTNAYIQLYKALGGGWSAGS